MTKKILSVMTSLVLFICTISSPAFANEVSYEEPIDVIDEYVVSCSSGGKHHMVGRGFGYVEYGGVDVINRGSANQCAYCNLVLISSVNPRHAPLLGNYILWNPGYQISQNVIIYKGPIQGSFTGNIATDSFWSGFSFP